METQSLEKTFATHDEFNRKPIAENIIRLLTSPIDLSPMVIDGGWGTGKTEFCQKLVRLMQQHPNFQPVYIDAFRSDHSGEPLLALLAEADSREHHQAVDIAHRPFSYGYRRWLGNG